MKLDAPGQEAFIRPPPTMPLYLKLGIKFAEREAGETLLPGRLLAWYPKAAISSGILEGLIAHGKDGLSPRLLQVVRLQTSLIVACPFCIAMNSVDSEDGPLTPAEVSALQGQIALDAVTTFTKRERLAAEYARLISATPLAFPSAWVKDLIANFTEREIVILATTIAQVNYWARLIQALGIPVGRPPRA